MKTNTDIFICTHKNFVSPVNNSSYKIITLDNSNLQISNTTLQVFDDTRGDSISYKQKGYCELSGIYWVWKNYKSTAKYIGFNHYRRYFSFMDDIDQVDNIFKTHNIITPTPYIYPEWHTIRYQYSKGVSVQDLDLIEKIIQKRHPEYSLSYLTHIRHGNVLYATNMFIMKVEDFDKYCNWLFDILFEYDKQNNINNNNDIINMINNRQTTYYENTVEYQSRVHGFLAERLFTLYVLHNYPDKTICKVNVVQTS